MSRLILGLTVRFKAEAVFAGSAVGCPPFKIDPVSDVLEGSVVIATRISTDNLYILGQPTDFAGLDFTSNYAMDCALIKLGREPLTLALHDRERYLRSAAHPDRPRLERIRCCVAW